ncbi:MULTISPECIES: integrase core domain-containing protein [Rothia]|jgi:ISRSO8-transposase orfB protein|uniref:Mobile element protein n=1 Tax=Rothia aeria TaxID=172042 RepID=A0A2Z5QXJ1_9MICC|nr:MULTISPECIES: integrase core domain-containing protein [Rothia]MDK7677380.1 integrase core domain-containing protein [Rothia aeria]QQT89863.1 transposase [Rothia aeria]RUP71974.1 hypothetical protein D8M41_07145 [Rothia sp. HSID18069]BAV87175.1 mobile element protein [Rothia aeria]
MIEASSRTHLEGHEKLMNAFTRDDFVASFNATLKNERVHRMVYLTKDKAVRDIASWIELRYNHVCLHSALGYRTPNEVERDFLDLKKAA